MLIANTAENQNNTDLPSQFALSSKNIKDKLLKIYVFDSLQ